MPLLAPGSINRKVRLRIGFLFGIAFLAFARPTAGGLLLGIPVAFAGLLVRAWAAGHIVKGERLTTTGPYAHTRNPLYFGSFLIAAGFALTAHFSLLLVVIALFVFIYGPTIDLERAELRNRFPEEYQRYESAVPAFAPRLTPWPSQGRTTVDSFSFGLYMRQREWQAALAFGVAVLWLVLRVQLEF
jgi:protein-S-isoprenylcysteine O-methyltransferase Ste14